MKSLQKLFPRSPNRLWRKLVLSPIRRKRLSWLGLPVIAITGTNGKTTVAQLMEQLLRVAGYGVGMCCTQGVMRHGVMVSRGDYAGPAGVWLASRESGIEVLVAETARGSIINSGFGYNTCCVAIVTNVHEDHLGLDGVDTVDQMARVKARVVQRVRISGTAVLNADDPRVATMAKGVIGRVIYYSMDRLPSDVPSGFFVHQGKIWRRDNGEETELIATGDIAIAKHGLQPYNLANVMAVLGGLDGIRSTFPVQEKLVVEFLKTVAGSPYSFRLVEFNGTHILCIQGKNPAGYAADMASLKRLQSSLGYEVVVGIITHVGDRKPSFHRTIAEATAEVCDFVMCVPPHQKFLRGGAKQTIVRALEAGVSVEKRLDSVDGDIASIIAGLRHQFPNNTLFVLLNTQQHQGMKVVIEEGNEISFDLQPH